MIVLLGGFAFVTAAFESAFVVAQQTATGGAQENGAFAQRRRGGGMFFRSAEQANSNNAAAGQNGQQANRREGGNQQDGGDQQNAGGGPGRGRNRGRNNEGGGEQGGGRGGRGQNPLQAITSSTDPATQAREVVQRLDQNGDGMLQGDEIRRMGWLMPADANKDSVLTIDELQAGFAGGTIGAQFGRGGRGGRENQSGDEERRGGRENRENNNNDNDNERSQREREQRNEGSGAQGNRPDPKKEGEAQVAKTLMSLMTDKSYRLKPGKSQLPKEGLPPWFASRDSNGDGQVAMNEYAQEWTDRLVNEFGRYDRNSDGVITPEEAARGR
jgi:hypothetical protein